MVNQKEQIWLVGALVLLTVVVSIPQIRAGGDCYDRSGGGGWGGNHAECDFVCGSGDLIEIEVSSSDSDAGGKAHVDGNTECGGADAYCEGVLRCDGTSASDKTPSVSNGGRGTCHGHSDETWRSALTVRCIAYAVPVPTGVCVETPQDERCVHCGDDCETIAVDKVDLTTDDVLSALDQIALEDWLASLPSIDAGFLRQEIDRFIHDVHEARDGVLVMIQGADTRALSCQAKLACILR